MSSRPNLRESDKARLRDWYDTSGTWVEKMTALYDLVGRITDAKAEEIARKRPSSHSATCPCRLHGLPRHPDTYPLPVGLLKVYDLCWCECDHADDEQGWAT